MKKKMISHTLESLPSRTVKQQSNLRVMATAPSTIDTSDIPEMTDEQWKRAQQGNFYRPVKRQITARVDADVLDWLKAQGAGYQSRMNAILRREMLTVRQAGAKKPR